MKKMVVFLVIAALCFSATPAFAGEYQDNMKESMIRGLKNVTTFWMEVPITVQEYHEGEGRPVIRHVAGLLDGTFQALVRAGSGAWDFLAALIPEHQEGMPVDPEVLV